MSALTAFMTVTLSFVAYSSNFKSLIGKVDSTPSLELRKDITLHLDRLMSRDAVYYTVLSLVDYSPDDELHVIPISYPFQDVH